MTGPATSLALNTFCLKSRKIKEKGKDAAVKPTGVLVAEADLEAHGIQDLADQIPAITDGSDVGTEIKFKISVLSSAAKPRPTRRQWKRLTSSSPRWMIR